MDTHNSQGSVGTTNNDPSPVEQASLVYTQTQEKGVLNTSKEGVTRFLGSSSGVHFLQNVKAVFISNDGDTGMNLDEQFLLEEEPYGEESTTTTDTGGKVMPQITKELGEKLLMPYFRYFHPLLPFLDGIEVKQDMEQVSQGNEELSMEKLIVLKSIFSIGLLEYPECKPQAELFCFKSASNAMSYSYMISSKYDIQTIRSLLAIQVYLYAKMYMQSSYEMSGLIRSKMHLAGLHRCPARYPQLSDHVCITRKRIYWSAYAIDRQLSQSLGLPIGYQDSDVDVCSLECENHMVGLDLPLAHSQQAYVNKNQMLVAIAYADYGKLIGQVIEMFNKAMHTRQVDRISVLELKSEIEAWRNRLPSSLVDDRYGNELPFENSCFFNAIYCHLNILTHRPRLSLSPNNPEFRYAIQVCIDNSRRILLDLTWQCKTHPDQSLFWPGYLSIVWMSGLMIAYASRIGFYPPNRAKDELAMCMPLCKKMAKRWKVAKTCEKMLKTLLDAFQNNTPPQLDDDYDDSGSANNSGGDEPPNKRFKTDSSTLVGDEESNANSFDTFDLDQFGTIDEVFELFNSTLMWKDASM